MSVEANLLAETMDETRSLTRFYIGKLKGEDMTRTFAVGDYGTNSPYWIIAHLTWAEHMLLVESMGHPKLDIPWLAKFAIGSKPASQDLPSFEEVLTQFKAVHEYALTNLRSMTDAQLEGENILGINFGGKTTKRFIAMHTIRHEGTHTGQLSLMAQFYGKKTI